MPSGKHQKGMLMTSVNTNFGALVALQNLNQTNKELSTVQSRINTGLKVSSARDDGAVYAIAQGLRGRTAALSAVNEGIGRATTNIDTALAAGNQVSNILNQLRGDAERAATFTSTADRQSAQNSFAAARDRIDTILNSATVNGVNLLNGSNIATGLSVVTSDTGTNAAQTVQAAQGATAVTANFTTTGTIGRTTTVGTGAASTTNFSVVNAADVVRIELLDASGAVQQTSNITLGNTATLGAFQDAVAAQTGNRVTVGFSGNSLVYNSDQNFSLTFVSGADPATANLAQYNGAAEFFTGSTAGAFVDGDVLGASRTNASGALQTGGARQGVTAALAAGTNATTLTTSLLDTGQTTGSVTFTTTASTGISNSYTVNITAGQTLSQFLQSVSTVSNGAVTAAYDANSRQVVYKSAQNLDVTNTNAAALDGISAQTADRASITRVSNTNASTIVSGYDFRVNGGTLASLASLDLTTDPTNAKTVIQDLANQLTTALGTLGAQARALDTQQSFLTSLSDNIE